MTETTKTFFTARAILQIAFTRLCNHTLAHDTSTDSFVATFSEVIRHKASERSENQTHRNRFHVDIRTKTMVKINILVFDNSVQKLQSLPRILIA